MRNLPLFSLVSFLFFTSTVVHAQMADDLAIVRDSEGNANVREKPSLKSKVIAKVGDGNFVWVWGKENDKWLNISFVDSSGQEQSGFIHHSRIVSLKKFQKLGRKVSKNPNVCVYSNDEIKVRMEMGEFEKKSAKITYKKLEDGYRYPFKINGAVIWGTDGGLPKEKYESIEITRGGETYTLPEEAIEGLYEPSFYDENTRIYYDAKSKTLYITAFNSDGAGGYVFGLRIVNGKYKDRFVFSPI